MKNSGQKLYKSNNLVKKATAIINNEIQSLEDLTNQFSDSLTHITDLMLSCSGHVLVAGAGTSRSIAMRFAHLLSCCGTPAIFISAADALHGGAGAVTKNDIIFAISKGGNSAEINKFAEISIKKGAKLITQTEMPDSPLGMMSDVIYKVVTNGDVDPFGMIATGSSLVNAAAGNVLCELLLEKRGYTAKEFAETHPGGAVGKKIDSNKSEV